MDKQKKDGHGRYPWQGATGGIELRAVAQGMEWKFPYRVVTVKRRNDGASARVVTVAPTWPPSELGDARTRRFESVDEAMAWAEGVYDEALGLA